MGIDDLFATEDISQILERPTNMVSEPVLSKPFNPFEEIPATKTQEPEPDPETPYDAQANASALVYGLQAMEQIVLTPIAVLKLRKQAGGREILEKMEKVITAKYMGHALSEEQKALLEGYEKYKADMNLLSGSLLASKAETQKLIEVALGYCEDSQLNVGKGLAFWATFTGGFVEKVTRVLLI